MGNVPTKEDRSGSTSTRSKRAGSIGSTLTQRLRSNSKSTLNNNNSNTSDLMINDSSAYKKTTKDRELFKTLHAKGLIVKFDENVDGGYLAPYGTYTLNLDYKVSVVKELILERKLAPFFTPLQDYRNSWTDEELLKVVDALSMHAPFQDNEDDEDLNYDIDSVVESSLSKRDLKKHLSKKFNKELKVKKMRWQMEENARFKTELHSKQQFSKDLKLFLYRNTLECPICFLYYPKWLNYTRCCNQAICTECFVQIKRLDPHFPHDEEGDESNNTDDVKKDPNLLTSEPAACPYCATPHFGVTYQSPTEFRTGMGGILPSTFTNNANQPMASYNESTSPMRRRNHNSISEHEATVDFTSISSSPLNFQENYFKPEDKRTRNSSISSAVNGHKRRGSIPVNHHQVISTDQIRPDWESKLQNARAKLAKRAAAANVIHASNLIIQDNEDELERKMIEEAMRLSLLDQETETQKRKGSAAAANTNAGTLSQTAG
ncbi:hypothetical protein WICPIJ_003553 [Wickerhamomyces pijperi]|uniref:Protein SIP5 n=1 Tax=Wickerhamomyces pijperi TaxID=599730 RepID=A0A9P8Q9D4_WICPI|nr:hypothetical protein WICPIJ_003553 [Wickerhamomyces pijperi]